MSDITKFRTAVAKLLDDASNARYTNDQIDQALQQALLQYSQDRPLAATTNVDGSGEKVIEMPADFQPVQVTGVELHAEDVSPQPALRFHAYRQDGSWFIELIDQALESTESIDITYTTLHTIDGLDGAAGTTIPDQDENAVQQGAAGYALLYRAVSRAESVNLQPNVQRSLLELSTTFLQSFRAAIAKEAGAAFADLGLAPTDRF